MKGTFPGTLKHIGENVGRAHANFVRFRLPGVSNQTIPVTSPLRKVERILTVPSECTVELPTFNPKCATKPNRYMYGVSNGGYSPFLDGLVKYDAEVKTAKHWTVHAHSPREAILLPHPEGNDEDDGTLLSVVPDGTKGKSHLLVMDAKSFNKTARAEMETVVSFGFHGTHIKSAI